MRAAREAMAGFGFEAAAAHYARALAEPSVDRIPILVEYGEAVALAGDTAAARDGVAPTLRARPRPPTARPTSRTPRSRWVGAWPGSRWPPTTTSRPTC